MTYRLPEDRCQDHHKQIDDTARQSVIRVDNGTINRISIPSFYQEHRDHDKMLHDHLGWPYPSHSDKSCQLPPGCEHILVLNEIDLPNEGYDAIEVSMVDPPEGLEFTGSIEYNVITLNITVMCPSAETDDLDVTFSAYATGTINNDYDEEDVPLRDVVTKGTLHIVAGPIA